MDAIRQFDTEAIPKLNQAVSDLNLDSVSVRDVEEDETSQCEMEKVVQNYTPIPDSGSITAEQGMQFAHFLQALTVAPPKTMRKVCEGEER